MHNVDSILPGTLEEVLNTLDAIIKECITFYMVSETHLNAAIDDVAVSLNDENHLVRCDRSLANCKRSSGGVLNGVSRYLHFVRVLEKRFNGAEIVGSTSTVRGVRVLVVTIYIVPKQKESIYCSVMEEIIRTVAKHPDHHPIIGGDLNLCEISFCNGDDGLKFRTKKSTRSASIVSNIGNIIKASIDFLELNLINEKSKSRPIGNELDLVFGEGSFLTEVNVDCTNAATEECHNPILIKFSTGKQSERKVNFLMC